ncbi:MAG: ATP-binding protein [Solirubrobacteraceae bacterium]
MRRTSTFPAVPQSVHAARRFATDAVGDGPRRAMETVELLVSELATNCIRHERATFHVTILRSPVQIRVEVTDGGSGRPQLRSPGPEEPSGRGLQIVEMLSDRWGVAPEAPAGKTVWFELDVSGIAGGAPGAAAADQGRVHGGGSDGRPGGRARVSQRASGRGSRSTVQGQPGPYGGSAQGCSRARRYCVHERGCDARRRRPRGDGARSVDPARPG